MVEVLFLFGIIGLLILLVVQRGFAEKKKRQKG
jgi:hypothetical protein